MAGKRVGLKRLAREYITILKNPVECIEAHPLEEDLFEWYYVLKPVQSPYNDGVYYGKLVFPSEYPMKPPDIYMITPSGRFETNTKICLSMSSFHPESWNPSWSVSTILLGIMSFMYEDTITTGSIETTIKQKKRYARKSLKFNKKFDNFKNFLKKQVTSFDTYIVNDEEENIGRCRYCYDTDGDLISPCECKGSNKHVHLECLKKWQYSTLLSQSTHPKYQTDIDEKCNVCLSKFIVKPDSRHEMILGFTGKELANMLDLGFLIVSGKESSNYNSYVMEQNKDEKKLIGNISNWTNAIYLITKVRKENDSINPTDGIYAIDLTRPIKVVPKYVFSLDNKIIHLRSIWRKYYSDIMELEFLDIKLFIGGPCNPEYCTGVCILEDISRFSITFKDSNLVPTLNQNNKSVFVGPIRNIMKLVKFYYKRTQKKVKINGYLGFAGWNRTQLLGEISRGGWGMCMSHIEDITKISYKNIWEDIHNTGRPMFAPKTDYSNNYNISSLQE